MARLTYLPIGSPLQASPERQANAARILEREQRLSALRADAALAWGEKYRQRVHAKGKLTLEERLSALVDPGSRRFELGSLVHHGRSFAGRTAPRAGVFTGIAQVQQRWVMLIGNDNTVASGAWWPGTPEKIQRAQSLALRLRIPVVYLVDSSGLFLPEQRHSFPGAQGAGGIFRMNSLLSDAGVVQLAAVLGDCIAGGGYMPIISDYVVMSEQAYMVIAGAALVGGAKHELIDPLSIGGADVHVHQSACADARAPDDRAAIAMLRQQVAQLPSSAHPFYRHGVCAAPPLFSPTELAQLLPSEPSQSYDIFEILARLLDDSLFCELLSGFGTELVTGVGRISGLPVGIIANRQGLCPDKEGARAGGILYRDGICKLSLFSRACDDDGLVLIWLQDVAGFDVGTAAEAEGLLGFGSNLIYANSTHRSPVLTVLLRKASGAGYYAMAGLPFKPVVQLATVCTRLGVMEGRTLALGTYRSKLGSNLELKESPEKEKLQQGMQALAEAIEADMEPLRAASAQQVDELVDLAGLRDYLVALVEACYQSSGTRRIKNPRIWTLHELSTLERAQDTQHEPKR